MASNKNRHNRIDYIEFSVTNMKTATDFYGNIFGWEFNSYGPEYTGIKGETQEAGGFALANSVQSGGPLVVIYSENLDKTLLSAKNEGALITKEIFEFPGGRRFEFKDPFGNELAVWTETSDSI